VLGCFGQYGVVGSRPSFLRLPDGRALAYSEFGDSSGTPVVNCHGGLTGRLDVRRCDDVAREAGVRVISPDRPGIGFSDPQPGRTLLDWPIDVIALVDALGIGWFGVLGWSAGGGFAAACASLLADRVHAAALVASAIPGDWPGAEDEINRMDRVLLRSSRRSPALTALALRAMGATARHAPAVFRRTSARGLDGPSRRVVSGVSVQEFSEPIAQGLRQTAGVLQDYEILGSGWGFDPGGIRAPVTVWQGDRDGLVPPSWGERLASKLPRAELNICRGEGHFLPAARYREVFSALSGAAGRS
jgi:pimeloyl-ACP methyl ester carboxylesterase